MDNIVRKWCFVVVLFALPSTLPALMKQDDLVISTLNGRVRGTTKMATTGKLVDTWPTIPYAKPPIGLLRFRRPQLMMPWMGVKDVTALPKPCWQRINPSDYLGTLITNTSATLSEDCLYLSITVPKPRRRNLPVLVWFHGGSFSGGATTLDIYEPSILASEENVVLVAVQYRVAAFGFSYFGIEEAPGNMGLYDQAMALFWVRYNVAAFGGDPHKITIFGESAGGASVSAHILSPVSKMFFNQAIMQSGTITAVWATMKKEDNLKQSLELARRVGCENTGDVSAVINCLRNVDASRLISEEPPVPLGSSAIFVPVVDGLLLPVNPLVLTVIKPYVSRRMNLILGSNSEEGLYFVHKPFANILPDLTKEQYIGVVSLLAASFSTEIKDAILAEYTDLLDSKSLLDALDKIVGDYAITCPSNFFARSFAEAGSNVYTYYYTHRPSVAKWPTWMGAIHAAELPFVFGLPLDPTKGFTTEEAQLSQRFMRLWANFARTGDPNKSPGTMDIQDFWPKHDPLNKYYKVLAPGKYDTGTDLRGKQCKFWEGIAKALLQQGRTGLGKQTLTLRCPSDGIAVTSNPLRCDTFYVCARGSVKLKTCPPGMDFDESLGTCNTRGLVYCGTRPGAPVFNWSGTTSLPAKADAAGSSSVTGSTTSSAYDVLYWQPSADSSVFQKLTTQTPFRVDVILERNQPYIQAARNVSLKNLEGLISEGSNVHDVFLDQGAPLVGKITIERQMPILKTAHLTSIEKNNLGQAPATQTVPVSLPVKIERPSILQPSLPFADHPLKISSSQEDDDRKRVTTTTAEEISEQGENGRRMFVPYTTFVIAKDNLMTRSNDPWFKSSSFAPWSTGNQRELTEEEKATSFLLCTPYNSSEPCDDIKENLVYMQKELHCCKKPELSLVQPDEASVRKNAQINTIEDYFWTSLGTLQECQSSINNTCLGGLHPVNYEGTRICCPLLILEEEADAHHCYRLYDEYCSERFEPYTYESTTICCGKPEEPEFRMRISVPEADIEISHSENLTKSFVQIVRDCHPLGLSTSCSPEYQRMTYKSVDMCCGHSHPRTKISMTLQGEEEEHSRGRYEVNVEDLEEQEEKSFKGPTLEENIRGKCHVLSDSACKEGYRKLGQLCCKFGEHEKSEGDIDAELDDLPDETDLGCESTEQFGRNLPRPVASYDQEEDLLADGPLSLKKRLKSDRGIKVSLSVVHGNLLGVVEKERGKETKAMFVSSSTSKLVTLSEENLNILKPYLGKTGSFEIPVLLVTSESDRDVRNPSIVRAEPDTMLKIAEERFCDGRIDDVIISFGALAEAAASFVDVDTTLEDWLEIR